MVIHHQYYSLSYIEKHEQAEWVAYTVTPQHLKRTKYERPKFTQDPKIYTASAHLKNFKKSGYDRGHLCPAADMKISKQAYEDTFYTSNVSPQLPEFNKGVWNRLENKVRYWVTKYDGLFVITGGVLENNLNTIGPESVSVPKFYYKILLDDSRGKYSAIAFLVPHEKSDKPLYEFVVSVRTIEALTGIDFFYQLPQEIQDEIEIPYSYKAWSF
jgi:endonuclease G